MEKITSLCKRRGFIFQGSEIYGGLAGAWDYGPLGSLLKENIKRLWWERFVVGRDDMYGLDASILMKAKVWEASGHTGAGFADPLVEDLKTKKRFRADQLLEESGFDPTGMDLGEMSRLIKEQKILSPEGNELSDARQFNLMFESSVGSTGGEESKVYLRPETAQGMFVNFKNVLDSMHPKLPFGLGQIGKAFRNEIAPRDFIFRTREFEQMEIEYFIKESDWEKSFSFWQEEMKRWMFDIGLSMDRVSELEVEEADRAHYSKRTIDFEFDFSFGRKELYGLAYRTDFDLKNHMEHSGIDMYYLDPETNEKIIPHVIEPTFGVDRTVLALLESAYCEDEMNGDTRVFLKLPVNIAPYKVAVFPLLKNKPELVSKTKDVYADLRKIFGNVFFDDNGNIGKRYRRQDEIGTPYCLTVDFDTLDDDTVTLRHRDSGTQERIKIQEIEAYIKSRL